METGSHIRIGIFFDAVVGHFATRLLSGVVQLMENHPEIQLVRSIRGIYLDRNTSLETLQRADGILAFCKHEIQEKLDQSGVPYLNMSGTETHEEGIRLDEAAISDLAFAHFQDRGLRQMGCVFCKQDVSSLNRRKSFRNHAEPSGQPYTELALDSDEFEREYMDPSLAFQRKVQSWFRQLEKPAGIFCTDDFIGSLFLRIGLQAGIKIPSEICLLGVNNNPEQCLIKSPHLSSVDLPFEALAYHSLDALLGQLLKLPSTPDLVLPPMGLIPRESTDYLDTESEMLRRAIRWIKKYAREPMGSEDVCRVLGVSRQYLNRKLKSELGLSITDVIRQEKLVHTKHLLVSTDSSLEAIVELCGYTDLNQLLRHFKKEMGITPTKFRQDQPNDSLGNSPKLSPSFTNSFTPSRTSQEQFRQGAAGK
jgi:LacI family transcriptional regulator